MTPAQRIRKDALGKKPYLWIFLMAWIKNADDYQNVRRWCVNKGRNGLDFHFGSEIERRMFLLFVAEALENE